jgi:putative flippase GtrA
VTSAPVTPRRDVYRALTRELTKFGVVGAINYVLDVGLFNLLILGPLEDKPLTAKGIATAVAATSSYFMNRHWTWRHRASSGLVREYGLFILLSAIALLITVGCLAFGEYVLDQQSWLARNLWGNVVGVGAAMVFRFLTFKRWVFLEPEPQRTDDAARAALV